MKKALFIFISFIAMACPTHADVTQLHIGIAEGYPPFYFFDENKQPVGICIEVIKQVADAMNISVHYNSYPWKRLLNYGKEGRVDAVMPLFKTAEREQFLLFPEVGLIDEDNSFFIARSSPIKYSGKLTDIVDLKVGVIDKYSYGSEFDSLELKNKTIANDTEQLILLVQKKRIELGIGNSKVIIHAAKKMGGAESIRFLSPPVTVSPLFVGFSKKTVDPDFVKRFNEQLQKFKTSETYAEIIRAFEL